MSRGLDNAVPPRREPPRAPAGAARTALTVDQQIRASALDAAARLWAPLVDRDDGIDTAEVLAVSCIFERYIKGDRRS